MGTHGHGTLADAMLGSTAQRVLRRAMVPVLTVRLHD
jgi:nucleotide-binding universal stress UspA family protein